MNKEKEFSQKRNKFLTLPFIKEHWSLIAVVPLLLGAFLQIVKLIPLGINYLRFFSSTQVLQDGIAFLVIILLVVVAIYIADIFIRKSKFKPILHNEVKASQKELLLYMFTFLMAISFFTFIIVKFWSFPFFEVVLMSIFLAIFFSIYLIFTVLRYYKILTFRQVYNYTKIPVVILVLSGSVISLSLIISLIFNSNPDYPLANLDNIVCIIESDSFPEDSHEILFYNDKYIFIEEVYKGESRIRVLPFDSFFNDSECK